VVKTWIAATVAALAFVALCGSASAFTKQDLTVTSFDGTPLATTLFVPDGAAPAGGWPAVVLFHGLGGDRSSTSAIAQSMGLVGEHYVVLTVDARGHGSSGGLIGIDGPNELRDVQTLYAWLAARPDVADAKIGAWGISLGGGAVWTSLAAGVPWAAVEVVESWTNLSTALLPQGLAKSGVIAGFIGSLPAARVDPSVFATRDAAYAGTLGPAEAFAVPRTTIQALKGITTPVFMMQGRRDFAFGMGQALQAYNALAGPKRLWLGLHGHAPSTFPAPDSDAMLAEGEQWFDRYLRGATTSLDDSLPVAVAPENWNGQPARFAAPPKPVAQVIRLAGSSSIIPSGKVQRTSAALARPLEVFGAPVVTVTADANAGWTRIVAVLSARTPAGKEIVVAGGGTPTTPGAKIYRIYLSNQATFVPAGSKLTLTIGTSSLAQNPGNLLYLDLPLGPAPTLTVGAAAVSIPALAKPVSR
jgi:Predicted acyl esterases